MSPGAPGSVVAIACVLSTDMGVIEPLQTKTTIEDLLEELGEVIRTSCMAPITLVGHSWGAWLVIPGISTTHNQYKSSNKTLET